MKNVLIIGYGEVGSALQYMETYFGKNQVYTLDLNEKRNPQRKNYDVIHICFNYSDSFIDYMLEYIHQFNAKIWIIHSTVPMYTTQKIHLISGVPIAHSPVRGIHPRLSKSLQIFTKYIGGRPDFCDKARKHLQNLKMKTKCFARSETTELMKLLSTSYYAWNILFAKEVGRLCQKYDLNYDHVYTHPNETYNDGYRELKVENVIRPVLVPPDGEIGGHCVSQNIELLPLGRLRTVLKRLNKI